MAPLPLYWTNAPADYDYHYCRTVHAERGGWRAVEVNDVARFHRYQIPRYASGLYRAIPLDQGPEYGLPASIPDPLPPTLSPGDRVVWADAATAPLRAVYRTSRGTVTGIRGEYVLVTWDAEIDDGPEVHPRALVTLCQIDRARDLADAWQAADRAVHAGHLDSIAGVRERRGILDTAQDEGLDRIVRLIRSHRRRGSR